MTSHDHYYKARNHGNIDASDDVVNGKIEPDDFADNVALDLIMDGNALEGMIESAMAATPDDPSRIAKQIRDYLSGVRRAAMQSARDAIESSADDD